MNLNVLIILFSSAMELVSSRNIDELVFVLKQEIAKTHNTAEHDDTGKYRQLLVRTLHTCSIKVNYASQFIRDQITYQQLLY